ncbi:hypothetical protein TPE_0890 [Treponema pedis str. T A4]|uniref:Uncharacterized protein n=1 Tax=Treponema pedis str. T A4 TaxID=1291379 RepID=S6A3A4_9SPIR|nr:hypothetical protein TPE_0890 [Treponema pedis str. T A4]
MFLTECAAIQPVNTVTLAVNAKPSAARLFYQTLKRFL